MVERRDIQIKGYVGPNGSGKTYLAVNEPCLVPLQLRIRINRLDPTLAEGAQVISDKFELKRALEAYKNGGRKHRAPICWDGGDNDHYGKEAGWKLASIGALQTGFVEILADEAHEYCGRHDMTRELEVLLSRNFHYRVPFKWTSTRARELAPAFRSQSHTIALFYGPDSTDRDYIKTMAKDLLEPLRKAGPYAYIERYRAKDPVLKKPYKVKK